MHLSNKPWVEQVFMSSLPWGYATVNALLVMSSSTFRHVTVTSTDVNDQNVAVYSIALADRLSGVYVVASSGQNISGAELCMSGYKAFLKPWVEQGSLSNCAEDNYAYWSLFKRMRQTSITNNHYACFIQSIWDDIVGGMNSGPDWLLSDAGYVNASVVRVNVNSNFISSGTLTWARWLVQGYAAF